jgi:hypothetical protein
LGDPGIPIDPPQMIEQLSREMRLLAHAHFTQINHP